jgi:hypothetical protein
MGKVHYGLRRILLCLGAAPTPLSEFWILIVEEGGVEPTTLIENTQLTDFRFTDSTNPMDSIYIGTIWHGNSRPKANHGIVPES